MDPSILRCAELLDTINQYFETIINNKQTTERDASNFILKNKAYHIIGSLLYKYNWGHHDAFLFPEFAIGNSYKADYLIVGTGSDGHFFAFVELESVYGRITTKSGQLGGAFRKGIAQLKVGDVI